MTEALNTELAFASAETVLIRMGELTIDSTFQMREQMNHSVIDDYTERLNDLPPVHVFEVETDTRHEFVLTDGFHRFFAHEKAESQHIPAKVIKGTRQDALKYAMAANFAHLRSGSKPSADDQKKAISVLCEAMMESFGYDSKAVIPALKEVGITASDRHLRKCTAAVRSALDEKRDAKIAELLEEGLSNRSIAKEVGVAEGTVRNIKEAAQKRNCAENTHAEDQEVSFECETESPEFSGFDEEEDEAPVLNPAEAQRKALNQFDSKLREEQKARDQRNAAFSAQGDFPQEARLPREDVAGVFNLMVGAWEKHGKEAFREFLTEKNEASEANRQEFLKIIQFAAHLIA